MRLDNPLELVNGKIIMPRHWLLIHPTGMRIKQELDPPAVAKFIADEYSFWAPLAKEAGMTVR